MEGHHRAGTATATATKGEAMQTATATAHASTTTRVLSWGVAFGVAQAGTAMAFWWLPPATVHALMVTLIAGVYIGFAVSDGRSKVIVVESAVVAAFFIASTVAVTATPWLVVAMYFAHGAKDLW